MEKRSAVAGGFLNKIKRAACLDSSSKDTGKGQSKSLCNKVAHGFHLVEGQSGHDMEDYHVAEYRNKKGHMLGLFAIFDGHLGDRVPSYLKVNLFNNILDEVSNPQKDENGDQATNTLNSHLMKTVTKRRNQPAQLVEP